MDLDLGLGLLGFVSDSFRLAAAVYVAFLIIVVIGAWSAARALK